MLTYADLLLDATVDSLYMCPHTAIYLSSILLYISVLVLLYVCPHTAIYVSSYCYISVLNTAMYLSSCCYMCPQTAMYASSYMYVVIPTIFVSSYHMFVLILLYMCQVDSLARCSLWRVEAAHTAICVSLDYCYILVLILLYMSPHTAIFVLKLLCTCPHTATYVSSGRQASSVFSVAS